MKQTKFIFFKNTPLIDFQNTIHFSSNNERDDFFLNGGHYETLNMPDFDFNFIRDRSSIKIPIDYNDFAGVNYCTFKSDFEKTRFYAYVVNYEYIMDGTIRVDLMIDGIMTYTQGSVLQQLPNLNIQRQHLTRRTYEKSIFELKNNDDIIKTNTKNYFHQEKLLFKDLIVLISASVDLQADFGTVDDPKMKTSYGKTFDNITSPLNLYACDLDDFNKLMLKLSPFPWISQNIKTLRLIPKIFMENNLTKLLFASKESLSGVDYLYTVSGINTRKTDLVNELDKHSYSMNDLYTLFELDPKEDQHLLRNEYTTTELYNFSGGQLFIDNGKLNPVKGLDFQTDIITGYDTQMMIYVDGYKVNGALGGERSGSYANDSLIYNQFDDIPMLIDTFNLGLAKSANQRQLAESKLISNRIANVTDPKANLKDRFFNAASLISNVSMGGLFGKFSDEYEFYRTQKAQQADMALDTPTITAQTNGNSFNIANQMFGIHFKYSKPTTSEMNKIKKYYKLFGYQANDNSNFLEKVDSMTICNYVQFSGSWGIDGADIAITEMMKAQFENGVRLWHNNGERNPMARNVLENKMK